MALSVFGLADEACEGGFRVRLIKRNTILIEIPNEEDGESRLRNWMRVNAVYIGKKEDCLEYKPSDMGE